MPLHLVRPDAPQCPECNGSGEGRADGTTCYRCRGAGVQRPEPADEPGPETYDNEAVLRGCW